MIDQTQMHPSSISPLGLFQVVMCNIKRPKWRTLEPELPEQSKLEGGPDLTGEPQTPFHTM